MEPVVPQIGMEGICALPAVNGLMVWTERVGHSCEMAAELPATRIAPAMTPQNLRMAII